MALARESFVDDAPPLVRESGADLRRTTWALAWPVIFSFSIEALVGLFDILMVGRLGATAVAGVGVGIQVMGYGSYTSYQYPAGLDLGLLSPTPSK